jgi:hypothetical protein
VHLKRGLLTSFAECFEEELPVGIVSHDPLPVIAPPHHVVDSPWILHREFASHWSNRAFAESDLSTLLADPFPEVASTSQGSRDSILLNNLTVLICPPCALQLPGIIFRSSRESIVVHC